MNPDEMVTAGLPDDFDGEITQVRLVPWDYDGNVDHHVLAVRVTIQPEGEDEFEQHYSAGDLEYFVPSMDGETPVDLEEGEGEELEGVFALKVGRRDQLNNSTNWAHFIGAAIDAGFPVEDLGASVDCFEGVYGHFNRIPQKKRSGIVVEEGGQARARTILVLTEMADKPKAAKPAAKAAKKSAKKKAAASTEDLDEKLEEVLIEALAEAEEGLPKAKLPGLVIKAFSGAQKAKAVKRVSDVEFLESSESWEFDADEAMLYIA
jgi:hypothetical protein